MNRILIFSFLTMLALPALAGTTTVVATSENPQAQATSVGDLGRGDGKIEAQHYGYWGGDHGHDHDDDHGYGYDYGFGHGLWGGLGYLFGDCH